MMKWPIKPKKSQFKTDEQFQAELSEYNRLKREYRKAYHKQWYSINREATIQRQKLNYSLNSEDKKEYSKNYYKTNAKIISEKGKTYREDRKKNPDFTDNYNAMRRAYHHKRKITDPQFVIRKSLRNLFNCTVNYHMRGKKTVSVMRLIGCTIDEFKDHIDKQFKIGMTWTPKNFHLDHIVPCASFDLTNPEQVKLCYHYTNFQPLWPVENLKKSAKIQKEKQ